MAGRRDFLTAGSAGMWMLARCPASFAQQQGKAWRIGFLGAASAAAYASRTEAVRAGLRDLGYVEGKNIVIEWRFLDGSYERLSGLAAELVHLKPDLMVAASSLSCCRTRHMWRMVA